MRRFGVFFFSSLSVLSFCPWRLRTGAWGKLGIGQMRCGGWQGKDLTMSRMDDGDEIPDGIFLVFIAAVSGRSREGKSRVGVGRQ